MSLPVAHIYCDRCDLRSNTMLTWGDYSYRLADGRLLAIDRCIGWCHDCRDLAPVEDFSERDDLAEVIAEMERHCRAALPRGFFGRLWYRFSSRRYELEYWQEELAEALLRRDFFQQRQSPARCLKCGSTAIETPNYCFPTKGEPPEPVGMDHPNCGGRLWIVSEGMRVALRFSEASIYDGEGMKL